MLAFIFMDLFGSPSLSTWTCVGFASMYMDFGCLPFTTCVHLVVLL